MKLKLKDDEFYFNSLNTDFDIENDNGCFTKNIYTSDFDSDIIPVKRQVMQLD